LNDAVGSTTAADNAGAARASYSSSGVTLGQPGGLSGDSATAATLNGSASYVALPSGTIPGAGAPVSIEARFKTTAGGPIFGYQQAAVGTPTSGSYVPALYVGTDGKLHGNFWPSAQMVSTASVNDGAWHQAIVTVDGAGNQALYLDGTQVGSASAVVNWLTMNRSQIGAAYTTNWAATAGGWWYFTGSLADVAIYHTALSGARAVAHHNAVPLTSTSTAGPMIYNAPYPRAV